MQSVGSQKFGTDNYIFQMIAQNFGPVQPHLLAAQETALQLFIVLVIPDSVPDSVGLEVGWYREYVV